MDDRDDSGYHQGIETLRTLVQQGLEVCCLLTMPDKHLHEHLHHTTVIFQRCSISYSLPAHCITDICPLKRYTPLPFSHPCIVGLVNVQGTNVVTLDLQALVAQRRSNIGADASLLVVSLDRMVIGFLVDTVLCAETGRWTIQAEYGATGAICDHG